ncbi:sn-glycerol-3-phosphate ABC transporter ATP-binding protein UgpC [Chelativorans sp. Marseille-P2723]|uniref:ABC transporter ATP-binding protein n=1 Tax=Chelativorans sp. Marseille-P2723 TaxID=2709133 RepID=UPI00156D520D|nr:sn-glycerol-3-phosphate ABC transporter ATP-binding protein UgpC [Chelativorans sp. Marseille-P2723]
MASIDIRSVRKLYGKTLAVRGIDLSVEPGEFVVILGPSGCGKSTLLRMIAGLEDISSGEILIGGAVVNDVDPARRGCAMVFQNYALYPHMTVAQNIGYALKVAGNPRKERDERVERIAKTLGLELYLDRKPNELSGGQRQRVAMGRAMVRQPSIFLFDEPLSNLDAKLRIQMRLEIKSLHRELKTTSVFVTHDQVEAMTLADKLVVMRDGKIEQVGSPSEVYRRPQSQFVASFLGSPPMNFLPAVVNASGRACVAGDIVTWPGQIFDLPENTRIEVAFRPAAAQLSQDFDGTNVLPFHYEMVEDLGSELHLYGSVAGTRVAVALPQETAIPPRPLGITVPTDAVHAFISENGRRVEPRLENTPPNRSLGAEQCRETSLSYI